MAGCLRVSGFVALIRHGALVKRGPILVGHFPLRQIASLNHVPEGHWSRVPR